jgi:hypothetical protein
MNGIRDQLTALKWLKANVADYGGDPSRITPFGQSAGGMSICVLMASAEAVGVFRRGIIESGPCIDSTGWGPGTSARGRNASLQMKKLLKVSTIAELRKVPAANLSWTDEDLNDVTFPGTPPMHVHLPWYPPNACPQLNACSQLLPCVLYPPQCRQYSMHEYSQQQLTDMSLSPGYFLDGELLSVPPLSQQPAGSDLSGGHNTPVTKIAAHAIMPVDPLVRYRAGGLVVDEILIGFNSKDGTAQYYGIAPFAANSSNGNYTSTMKVHL